MSNRLRLPRFPSLLLIGTFLFAFASASWGDEDIDLTRKFSGKINDTQLQSCRPDSGIINDIGTWQKLWVAWRPNRPVQKIDFQKQLVLVDTVPGPNMVFTNRLKLNDQGDVQYEVASTKTAGPGFGYLIMIVPKAGIKTVNGKPVDGKPVFSEQPDQPQPTQPAPNQPAPKQPQPVPDQSSRVEPIPTSPRINSQSVGEESIAVEIVGGVRTNILSAGAETTGNLIAANNIVWELDFQENEQLFALAQDVGTSLARVKGKLSMLREPGSRVRWIVQVESVQRLNLQPPPLSIPDRPASIANNEDPNAQPMENPAINPEQAANQPTQRIESDNVTPDIRNAEPDANFDSANPAQRNAFKQISIVTNDGQTQTITGEGFVSYESQSRNSKTEWILKPTTLARFHQFVDETQWALVKGVHRGNANDELNYTISIEMAQGAKRIFIDSTAVASEPTMKQLFDLISQAVDDR